MKKVVIALLSVVLTTSCLSVHVNGSGIKCKGPVVVKDLELKDFTSIVVNGSSDINLTQSDTYSVVVTANEEVFDHIDYRVEEGVLVIGTKKNITLRAEKYEIAIALPQLESFIVNGAADLNQLSTYSSDKDLTMQVNGAGDLNIIGIKVPALTFTANGACDIKASGLDVQNLVVNVNGAGDAVLSGKAVTAHFSVNGAGDIDARNLECESYTTHRAGVASIRK